MSANREQAFASRIVDHVEDAEAPPAGELVVHEVERPARVRHRRRSQRRPRPDGATAAFALAHRKALGAIEPVDLVAARRLAVASQQHVQPPVAEAMTRMSEIAQPRPQRHVVRPPRSIADLRPIRADEGRGPPLAHLEQRPKMSDGLALLGGRSWLRLRVRSTMESQRRAYHFFPRNSFSAAASSIASASSRFSLAFSSSSAFRRLASDTSRPAVLGLPVVQRRLRHPVLPAKVGTLRSGLLLTQNADDLLFRKMHTLHRLTLRGGQTLDPAG